MKFIYFYSESYEFYNKHIKENLNDIFELKAIKIDDIKEKKDGHHFDGLNIKIEFIINEINENMNNNIIFSDATIFINSNNRNELLNYFDKYNDYDLCFIKEGDNIYNIGLIYINCNKNTLQFFENVLKLLNSKEITHDQAAVNKLLPSSNLKYTTYDNKIFCGLDFKEENRNDYIIYKSFINNTNKISNFNQRIQIFYNNNLIDKNTYDKYFIIEIESFSNKNSYKFNIFYIFIVFIIILLIIFIIIYKNKICKIFKKYYNKK